MNPPDNVALRPSGFVTVTSQTRSCFGPLVYVLTKISISVEFATVRLSTVGERPCPLRVNTTRGAKRPYPRCCSGRGDFGGLTHKCEISEMHDGIAPATTPERVTPISDVALDQFITLHRTLIAPRPIVEHNRVMTRPPQSTAWLPMYPASLVTRARMAFPSV